MSTTRSERRLRRGELLSVRLDRETGGVRVVAGAVWATMEGDPRDHVAAAGEALRLMGPGLAVLEALEDGTRVVLERRRAYEGTPLPAA